MMQQQTYLLELYRAGLRSASDIAKASFENAQRLHAQQLDALREALDSNTRSAQRLSEATSIADLMALQVKLAGTQAEQAADRWRCWVRSRARSASSASACARPTTTLPRAASRVR